MLKALAVGAAVAAGTLLAVPAQASVPAPSTGIYSYNRPSTVEAGGAEYIAWADKATAGLLHIGTVNSDGSVTDQYYYNSGGMWPGTGPTIAAVNGSGLVVAWVAGDGEIKLAEVVNGEFECLTTPNTTANEDGTPQALSHYTVDLTTEGDDGTGQLYMTWADTSGGIYITSITPPPSSACSGVPAGPEWGVIWSTDTGQTAWSGPALAISHYGASNEHFWLVWAGTNSTHSLNIEEFAPGLVLAELSKGSEPTHSTNVDMGAAYDTATGYAWMSYCGTNDVVYYQEFTGTAGGTETTDGGQCDVYPSNTGTGWLYGGVGVGYEYSDQRMLLSWPAVNGAEIALGYE
jgi:hypothetical protein